MVAVLVRLRSGSRMNAKILPGLAVGLAAWMLVGDVQSLVGAALSGVAVGPPTVRILADLMLLFFAGRSLRPQRKLKTVADNKGNFAGL